MLRCLVTLPPPVTGRTLATQAFLDILESGELSLDVRNLAPSHSHSIRLLRTIKGLKSFRELVALMIARHKPDAVYLVVDHGWGLIYAISFAGVARLRGIRLFLHHHVYAYVNQRSRLFGWLLHTAPNKTTHITLCGDMAEKIRHLYGVPHEILVAPNLVQVSDLPTEKPKSKQSLSLGHLSNLTFEKGLREVIEVWYRLRDRGVQAKLRLAGPAGSRQVRKYVQNAIEDARGGIQWEGPVDAQEKTTFYAALDWFLFPTQYRNEAQPLVLLEALGHGVPVVANDRGCIGEMIGEGGGYLVRNPAAFVDQAVESIVKVHRFRDDEVKKKHTPRQRYEDLQKDAQSAVTVIISRLQSV